MERSDPGMNDIAPTDTPTPMARRFDEAYFELLPLKDGTVAELRLLRPEDKILLLEGIQKLSRESSYRRFFTIKRSLTKRELAYLTELDQESHFAIGASRTRPDGRVEGLGVARFIRLAGSPHVAEPAIAVIDAAQGLGLGHNLMARLLEAARERGVKVFRSEVLATNDQMKAMLAKLGPTRTIEQGAGVVTLDVLLDHDAAELVQLPAAVEQPEPRGEHPHDGERGPMYRLLALAAEGLVLVRRTLHFLEDLLETDDDDDDSDGASSA